MDELARTLPLPESPRPDEPPLLRTARSACHVLPPGAALPEGCELSVPLPDGSRFAYVPLPVQPDAAPHEVAPDPFLRGNQFRPLLDAGRTQAALVSIAVSRRMEMGPESERVVVFLRGQGLVFLENGDTHRFEPRWVGLVPPGEPARVWSQGPEDVLAVVVQPRGQREERRTLAGEVARRRAAGP